jgi:hypothetical protein
MIAERCREREPLREHNSAVVVFRGSTSVVGGSAWIARGPRPVGVADRCVLLKSQSVSSQFGLNAVPIKSSKL